MRQYNTPWLGEIGKQGDAYSKESSIYRGEDKTEDTYQVPFTEEELAVLKKILTLGCVTAHGNG